MCRPLRRAILHKRKGGGSEGLGERPPECHLVLPGRSCFLAPSKCLHISLCVWKYQIIMSWMAAAVEGKQKAFSRRAASEQLHFRRVKWPNQTYGRVWRSRRRVSILLVTSVALHMNPVCILKETDGEVERSVVWKNSAWNETLNGRRVRLQGAAVGTRRGATSVHAGRNTHTNKLATFCPHDTCKVIQLHQQDYSTCNTLLFVAEAS